MLGWSQEYLSEKIGKTSKMCVYRFENEGYDNFVSIETIERMKKVMEDEGIDFIGLTGLNIRIE